MNDSFIKPNTKIEGEELHYIVTLPKNDLVTRWNTDKGNKILQKLIESKFNRTELTNSSGQYYDHYDLRGIDLSNKDLTGYDLSMIDFYGSNFKGAKLMKCNLKNSWFSEANIENAIFDYSIMDNVLLDNSKYNNKTSFVGVNINSINFNLAALTYDLALHQQKIDHFKNQYPVLAYVFYITSNYGKSLLRWSMCCFILIVMFSLVFYLIPNLINQTGFGNALYFSVVTFTTLGYGDILPISLLGKLLAIIEVSLGYLMSGVLIAILTKRLFL